MITLPSSVVCAGCGAAAPSEETLPVRCPNAGRDDVDHVMQVVLDARRLTFPGGSESNPFVRYRTLLHSYHLALRYGMTDADYVALVGRLDDAVARVDGHGFVVTPFGRQAALSDRLGFTGGGVWVKDETGNVSGSHKARHLMGVLIYLELTETLGLADRAPAVTWPLPAAATPRWPLPWSPRPAAAGCTSSYRPPPTRPYSRV